MYRLALVEVLILFYVLQGPREFVITFPRSYHGGFNTGESTAPPPLQPLRLLLT